MKPFIFNVDRNSLIKGKHPDPGPNSVLIQIGNPGSTAVSNMAVSKHNFREKHFFAYYPTFIKVGEGKKHEELTSEMASDIVSILMTAEAFNMNVIVQCESGSSCAGTLVAFGDILGFETPDLNSVNIAQGDMRQLTKAWHQHREVVEA